MQKRYTALPLSVDDAQTVAIAHPEWLSVYDKQTRAEFFGARQSWFPKRYQRQRGCGVVTASLAMAYGARKPHHVSLYQPYLKADRISGQIAADFQIDRQNFLGQMQDLWRYLTPPLWGVSLSRYTSAISRFASDRGLVINCEVHKASLFRKRNRRNFKRLVHFLQASLKSDMPVAMLIYSNGQVSEVMSRHWITILAIQTNNDFTQAEVTVSDHGRKKNISLDKWFYTSRIGGAFVAYKLAGRDRH